MDTLSLIAKLPMRQLNTVYHVGTLDISQRRPYTYEGLTGLSVSTCPQDWRRIARLSGECYQLTKKPALFIDHHAIDDDTWQQLFCWGSAEGLLVPHTYYFFEYEDDEWDTLVRSVHFSEEEATLEADGEHAV